MASVRKKYRDENGADKDTPVATAPQAAAAQSSPPVATETPKPAETPQLLSLMKLSAIQLSKLARTLCVIACMRWSLQKDRCAKLHRPPRSNEESNVYNASSRNRESNGCNSRLRPSRSLPMLRFQSGPRIGSASTLST